MPARSFVWLSAGGGAWSLASNWADITDGNSPSRVAPGSQDSVTVAGPSGAQVSTLTGGGAVASAIFTGNSLLSGVFSAGSLTVGQASAGGILRLGTGTSLSAGSAAIGSGSMIVGGGGTLAVGGTLSLGLGSTVAAAALNATGGGAAAMLALVMNAAGDSIYVDPASIVEVGSAGIGRAGLLTIDAGATLSGQGSANAFGGVFNGGTVAASGGTLTVGALSGAGNLQIGAGATLALNGACGSGQTVSFAGANATLALNEEFYAPGGMVSGFAAGDAIDVRGSQISSASFAQTNGGSGVLTLYYGGQVAAQLQLSGSFGSSVFLVSGDGAGGTLVSVAASGGSGGPASPGTPTPDQYVWTAGSGAWNVAANWQDVTAGSGPAAIAPGAADLVSITAAQTAFSVIAGPANAATVSLLGEVALTGAYTTGTLTVGKASGVNFTAGTLDLLAGASLAAGSAWIADGAISVSGSAASLSVGGALLLGGGSSGVGLPTAGLTVTAGGHLRAGSLILGGGSGASVTTDPVGSVEIGSAGGAVGGAVTVDAGATLSGNGQVNPYGNITDNGAIIASNGTLTLGAVSGSGSLVIAAGATMELISATSAPIVFQGSGGALAFAGARAAPTGTLSGLAAGDVIDLEGSPLTAVQYTASGTGGTLLLLYGSVVEARIAIAGNMAGLHFLLTPDGLGGSDITVTSSSGTAGGGGQSGTDQLAWASPVSGSWSRGANWADMTMGGAATQPPGAQTPVQIGGPVGGAFESVAGTGVCASLSATGNTALGGVFATGQLTLGTAAGQEGTIDVGAASTLTAVSGTLADGALLSIGVGAFLGIAGTLTMGGAAPGVGQPDTLLAAAGRGGIQLGCLTMGGGDSNTVTVDSTAWIEVGTAGGAAAGALTIDVGASVSGNGTLDASGLIVDNGSIQAAGGLLLLGAVAGSGTIGIGTEATLGLTSTDLCPIAFAGGGGTLLLPALSSLPGAVISGFAAGDSIIAGSPLDAVSYQPGALGIGTLTLSAAGQVVGQLLLAGNYAGETFGVLPDGTGAAIILSTPALTGPPAGTVTPDSYVWTGNAGGLAWANAGNWSDISQGGGSAAAAPGQNDSVSIAGAPGTALAIAGPANAASLAVSGTVALGGAFSAGALSVGASSSAPAFLALGSGAAVSAASAGIVGGVAVGGSGVLSVAGTLSLGSATNGGAGMLAVSGTGTAQLGMLLLGGTGSQVATGGGGSVEIGFAGGAAPGITIDAGYLAEGAGALGLASQILDQGTIAASSGTLFIGSVSGTGTLLAGPGADLVLTGSVAASLTADFAAAGTITLSAQSFSGQSFPGAQNAAPDFADFGTGDSILLSGIAASSAVYAATGPGIGVLSLMNGTALVAQLSLLGSQAGQVFSVTGAAGGGTILTTQPDKTSASGDSFLTYPNFAAGPSQITRGDLLDAVAQGFPFVSQTDIGNLISNEGISVYYSTDGLPPAATVFGGANEVPGVNVEVVAPLDSQIGGSGGPGSAIALQSGYSAVLLEGGENIQLTDGALGGALLVGNEGSDAIAALGDGDTLVGATGANTTFYAALDVDHSHSSLPVDVYIHGGGNDGIATNYDNAAITTSGGHSNVFLGPSQNSVVSGGSDTIICAGIGGSDTIEAQAGAGRTGDLVFSSGGGLLNFIGGDAPSTVIGNGAQIEMQGGNGSGSLLWGGSSTFDYYGGAGGALIVAGSGHTHVQGGSGPVTVFGGTGPGVYSGAAGSVFVVGAGASTVQAAAGENVYVTGAAQVSVAGSGGANVFGGTATGDNIFQAFAGGETLWGGAGDDLFIAGSGRDVLVSGGGNDTFSFTDGVAADHVALVGFVPGESTIALHGYGSTAPAITYAFGDSIVNLAGGAQIIVENVTNLSSANFVMG